MSFGSLPGQSESLESLMFSFDMWGGVNRSHIHRFSCESVPIVNNIGYKVFLTFRHSGGWYRFLNVQYSLLIHRTGQTMEKKL